MDEQKQTQKKEDGTFIKSLTYNYFIEILHFFTLVLLFILQILKVINQQTLLFITILIISSVVIRFLVNIYLNFIITIRSSQYFPDNRTANFLTFDVLKFILIFIALLSIIILGLNKVLNNETIATLLGGLVGSLLTMKGSYTDLRLPTKEEHQQVDNISKS